MTDVRDIFEAHADLVWRVLARSGVRDADLGLRVREAVARTLTKRLVG